MIPVYTRKVRPMKTTLKCIVWSVLVFAAVCLGCGGDGGSSGSGGGTGTLSIGLTDTSTLKYKAVYVTIDAVQVNRDRDGAGGNSGWVTVATPERTYNLLSLVNGVTAVLGDRELDAGTYRQIRLIIGKQAESEKNILGDRHPYANYVIPNDGSDKTEKLKIPSGFQTGLKLVHHFRILDGSFVELVLDFDACRSVVETGNRKFILKPTVKVIETEDKSTVFGDVTEAAEWRRAAPLVSGLTIAAGFWYAGTKSGYVRYRVVAAWSVVSGLLIWWFGSGASYAGVAAHLLGLAVPLAIIGTVVLVRFLGSHPIRDDHA